MKSILWITLICAAFAVMMGCKSDSTSSYNYNNPNPGGSPPPPANTVAMTGSTFSPASLTVKAGTTVTWKNNDGITHTTTSDTGVWDSGNVGGGGSTAHTFPTAGTFHYHCTYHQAMGMVGTIIVQ